MPNIGKFITTNSPRTGQTARPFFLRENQKTDIINNHWKDFSLDTKQDGATQKIILKKNISTFNYNLKNLVK